jgi:YD repeat-containing protein
LTSASHPLLATPQVFAYDPVGNRTAGGSVVNAGNQLTADATHSYQYDDNGNLTRKTFLATGNFTQYTYDAENRLTKVEEFVAGNPTAFATSTYRYDGLGRRIEKVANGQTKRLSRSSCRCNFDVGPRALETQWRMNLKTFGKYLQRKSVSRLLHQARKDSHERPSVSHEPSRTFRRRPAPKRTGTA